MRFRIDLPRLVLIADGFTRPEVAARVAKATEAGVMWVQLRDHDAEPDAFRIAATAQARTLRRSKPGLLLSVNSDLETAAALSTGVHLGRRGPSVAAARERLGAEAVIGFSAHDLGEAAQAVAEGADYLFFSPVFPTTSKPGQSPVGRDALHRCCETFPNVPVFALGGITPERVALCRAAGAYGVAVLSGILDAPDPAAATHAYLDALRHA